ncbi:Bis(5'-nucleosyl)-tetraphosphatase PrpE [asymmetrical] [Pirellulimonas nuda]|uniref:Bis(5'-nucleosyl)-tetraphosphatase PrpE [asymmetrical] n=1 Tax=Pirellulimonas nuda TaxID=2528009 RepID=A0A518DBY1_9BACT|nr:polynucleotide kinase-phosphatase [Pirellulimonas nuda]QDU88994.1 Bis(5'-nucleosyl)-tetraphosphatase PrpE [asymmetrical] [Pirellulimonas nuda]
MTKLSLPNLSLVLLIGPSGAGKSTFARRHFLPTEVLSSDACRGLVSDDPNNQAATNDAFDVLHYIAAKRLAAGRLTVVDATNVQPEARRPLISLARAHHVLPVAIVLNLPEEVCIQRNRGRADRDFGPHVIRNQRSQLRRSLKGLKREGFRHVFVMESPDEVDAATIVRVPLWNDKRDEHGPFDFIGDVHGCCDELEALLTELGYRAAPAADPNPPWAGLSYAHPDGRKAVFVGDLVDRGPRVVDTLSLVRNMMAAGAALCVPGNHDVKLLRKLRGKNVQLTHGLAETMAEIDAIPEGSRAGFCRGLADFLDGLISHYVLDDGKIVVAHAGMKESMQGRGSGKVREFALYGETTGETDEFGLPVRYPWASEYRGAAMVVYGHTPVPAPEWLNKTLNIDTGCVFGGALTALRYPELETVSVQALQTYCEPARPFLPDAQRASSLGLQQEHDDLLDLADVIGKRIVSTRLRPNITIREENGTAALEVMSRFAADPRWLVYLPPTMSPSETSAKEGYLEHPEEALAYYRSQGIATVVCEEKHMGSRAVVVVCRDAEAAARRFGVQGEAGVITTRTGRRFFSDPRIEEALLGRVRDALTAGRFWEEHVTDWVVLDCELMPWSAKAQELLKNQYAAVGSAATAALPQVVSAIAQAADRLSGEERDLLVGLREDFQQRGRSASRFVDAYRHYCWPVDSVDDLKLAPFHVLASEGRVHVQQDHRWHMQTLAAVCTHDPPVLLATPYRVVDVTAPAEVDEAVRWWTELTDAGGEGMVVKPLEFIARGKKGLLQPAVKCRGREYLRIIYGPDYTREANLKRLRSRGLGGKRSLALREFALGIEALERFVRREPLRRVHECVFGVLALESEPVDPRL